MLPCSPGRLCTLFISYVANSDLSEKKSVTLLTSVWLYTPWCFLNFPGFFLIQINGRGKHFYVTKCNLGFAWPRQKSLCGFRMGKHLPPPFLFNNDVMNFGLPPSNRSINFSFGPPPAHHRHRPWNILDPRGESMCCQDYVLS